MITNDKLLSAIKSRGQKQEPFAYGIVTGDVYVRTLQELAGLEACYRWGCKGHTSFSDALEKSAKTLVYSNPDMIVEEKTRDQFSKLHKEIELPKNTLMAFRHVLTTNRKDRDGDILRTEGMEVDPKMLLLWQHVHTMPIGKMVTEVDHTEEWLKLISCIVDMNETCHDAAVMVDNDMGRFSHGFNALEFERMQDEQGKDAGFDVKRGEIMEESLVSVPANIDADTEEVLLSLIEGGKLTSPIMKEVGNGIRMKRPLSLPVNLDVKLTLNGEEIKSENKSRDREKERTEGSASTSEKANGDETKDKEEEKTSSNEVKSIYGGDIRDSWEWIESKLRKKVKNFLLANNISVSEHSWTGITATFPDYALIYHEFEGMDKESYYKIAWKMEGEEPEFSGVPTEVEIKQRTEVQELKKKHQSFEKMKLEKGVTAQFNIWIDDDGNTQMEEADDKSTKKELTMKEAMAFVVANASVDERKQIVKWFEVFDQVEKGNQLADDYRAVTGT